MLHLEFGMVHLIFSSQKNAQILRSLWKKVRRFEKGTPPPVVAVVTIMRYDLVPGVQVHDGDDEDADQAAGSDLQLLGEVPLELQGVGLKGGQARFPAQCSPCHPQS